MNQSPIPFIYQGYSLTDFSSGEGWNCTATVVDDRYGQFFMSEGPTVFLEPVAFWSIRLDVNIGQSFTAIIPMIQTPLAIPAPIGFTDQETILRAHAREGVTLGATRFTTL